MRPYFDDGQIQIWLGDCRDVLPLITADVLVTDPPYPNNGGHFDADVAIARQVLAAWRGTEALVFWSELEAPPVALPLVAVHIFHRNNVNGRPYEPIYHFAADGQKRRSEVKVYWHIKPGIGPAANEYAGHPTQKPTAVMTWLLTLLRMPGAVVDPFMGVGSTLRAALNVGRPAIGIECDAAWCATAVRRLAQGVLPLEVS